MPPRDLRPQADAVEQILHPAAEAVHRHDLGQRCADGHARIEAAVGILEDHLSQPRQGFCRAGCRPDRGRSS
jgi:hypothetical protein